MSQASKLMLALLSLTLVSVEARASLVTFVGEDLEPTANPTVRTNSDAAAALFNTAASAIGTVSTITFEGSPLGNINNLSVATGVTLSGSDFSGNPQTIRNTTNFPSYPSVDGSNTTAAGAKFVELQGGTLVFTFAQPTQFFGLYLTGVQTNFFADKITFNDGSSQSIALTGNGTSNNVGETAFLGFTDAGKFITGITITAGNANGSDFIGADDVRFQTGPTGNAPEPATLALLGLGLAGLCFSRRKQ